MSSWLVTGPHADRLGGALAVHRLNDRAPLAVALGHDPVPGPVDPLDGEQFRHHGQRLVDRDREADSLGAGPHGDVDADHLAVDVEEWPAGIARIDARVGLDEILVLLRAGHLDVAVKR